MSEPFDHGSALAIMMARDKSTPPVTANSGRVMIRHAEHRGCRKQPDDTDDIRVVRRTLKNGARQLFLQCGTCGRGRCLRLSLCRNLDALPEWDPEIADEAWEANRVAWEAEKQQKRDERKEAYDSYIGSNRWSKKRAKVLLRAGGVCECCGEARADQVHHTTYIHLGDEPLWELRAVCRCCHERIHGIDREGAIDL